MITKTFKGGAANFIDVIPITEFEETISSVNIVAGASLLVVAWRAGSGIPALSATWNGDSLPSITSIAGFQASMRVFYLANSPAATSDIVVTFEDDMADPHTRAIYAWQIEGLSDDESSHPGLDRDQSNEDSVGTLTPTVSAQITRYANELQMTFFAFMGAMSGNDPDPDVLTLDTIDLSDKTGGAFNEPYAGIFYQFSKSLTSIQVPSTALEVTTARPHVVALITLIDSVQPTGRTVSCRTSYDYIFTNAGDVTGRGPIPEQQYRIWQRKGR